VYPFTLIKRFHWKVVPWILLLNRMLTSFPLLLNQILKMEDKIVPIIKTPILNLEMSPPRESPNRFQGQIQVPSLPHLPTYANIHPTSMQQYILDEILEQHKCIQCWSYLCCGGQFVHEVNCWALDLYGTLTYDELLSIYQYRIDVYRGKLIDYTDWAFEPFNVSQHVTQQFKPHYIGFYIRCFKCVHCKDIPCCSPFHEH